MFEKLEFQGKVWKVCAKVEGHRIDDPSTLKKNYGCDMVIRNNQNIDFIFGSVRKHWGILHGYKPEKIKYSWGFYSSHSTGFFIKKDSAKVVGYSNTKYKYHADYDYFFRMIVKKKNDWNSNTKK